MATTQEANPEGDSLNMWVDKVDTILRSKGTGCESENAASLRMLRFICFAGSAICFCYQGYPFQGFQLWVPKHFWGILLEKTLHRMRASPSQSAEACFSANSYNSLGNRFCCIQIVWQIDFDRSLRRTLAPNSDVAVGPPEILDLASLDQACWMYSITILS